MIQQSSRYGFGNFRLAQAFTFRRLCPRCLQRVGMRVLPNSIEERIPCREVQFMSSRVGHDFTNRVREQVLDRDEKLFVRQVSSPFPIRIWRSCAKPNGFFVRTAPTVTREVQILFVRSSIGLETSPNGDTFGWNKGGMKVPVTRRKSDGEHCNGC